MEEAADHAGIDAIAYELCGVNISSLTVSAASEVIVRRAKNSVKCEVHLCNSYTLSLVDRDYRLREALARADLNLPDGAPVAWLGWRRGVRGPVRGPSLMRAVMRAGSEHGLRHYLYGGKPGVAERMADNLQSEVPGLSIVGTDCPPFRRLSSGEFDELVRRICRSEADVVWIGLGTPRQDHLVAMLGDRISKVLVPVGAAFDFASGDVSEAPECLHGSGLEWLFRLWQEPRRLWRRYLVDCPRFLGAAILSSSKKRFSTR